MVVKIARTKTAECEQILATLPYTKGALFEYAQSTEESSDAEALDAAPRSTTTLATSHPCASEGSATKMQFLNVEQDNMTMASSQEEAQPLSPDEESLYPLDSRCVSYILIQVKNLDSYSHSCFQSRNEYRFCNPIGCGLESSSEVNDKRPYVSLGLIFDRKRKHGPNMYKMDNTFIPGKISEKKLFPQRVPQDHAFARVLVNPQYAFKNLTDSLNNLLDANPSKSKYLVEPINNFAKAFQKPLCLAASTLKVGQYHWTESFNKSQMCQMSNRIVPSPITASQDHSTTDSDNSAMVYSKLE